MSSSSSAPRGVLLAGLGALAALASLWLPWYTIRLPEMFRDALGNMGGTGATGGTGGTGAASGAEGLAGAFAGMFKSLAAIMPEEITANGWTAMSGGDIGLAVAAALVLLLVIVAGGVSSGVRVDRGVAGRMMAFAGLVVAGIAVYHVISKPGAGTGAFSASVTIKPGIWVALLGGVLMIAGGLMTASTPKAAAAEPAPAPAGGADDGSSIFAPPVDSDVTMAAHDPFAAPALDPFAVPAPMPAPAHDPFADPVASEPYTAPAEPEPYVAPAAFAMPDEPQPAVSPDPYPSSEPYAAPEPYVAPDPYPSSEPVVSSEPYAAPEPYVAPDPYPSSEPVVSSDPYPSSEPYAAPEPDPYATPEPVAHVADETPVPDWAGFQPLTEPDPAQVPEPAMSGQASEARPAGVSIPPPGWTGAA